MRYLIMNKETQELQKIYFERVEQNYLDIPIFDSQWGKKIDKQSFGKFTKNSKGYLSWEPLNIKDYPEFALALSLEGFI